VPKTYEYTVHKRSRALWPEHKSLAEVLELEATTPEGAWSATYQGRPTPPGGVVFLSAWWNRKNRYDIDDPANARKVIGRWLSIDTASKDKQRNDFTACLVAELWADYRLALRWAWAERLGFPQLQEKVAGNKDQGIIGEAERWNRDHKLKGILIEDKNSGTSLIQTMRESSDVWLTPLLKPISPQWGDKRQRADQSAIWCKQDCVLLPYPSENAPWLLDFTDQIWTFPGGVHDDYVDALSQLLIYLEHVLAAGLHARLRKKFQEEQRAAGGQDAPSRPLSRVARGMGRKSS
jgi:predicted phage terminase large subunit-like protein